MQKWLELTEIVRVLHLTFVATKMLQIPSFTLSDFFGCWLKMKYKLNKLIENEKLITDLATTLLQKLIAREKDLLHYPSMLCAIYLDRRYKKELKDNDHIAIAKHTLINLYERVVANRQPTKQLDESESSFDSFEQYLRQDGSPLNYSNTCAELMDERVDAVEFDRIDFMRKLQAFDDNSAQIHYKTNILDDWEARKEVHPELYEVACIIYGIPPSQVTVERAFSAMAFVFNPKRSKLSQKMLEDILMIKLNSELVQSINDRDLDALKK